jgi:hypothetical protein
LQTHFSDARTAFAAFGAARDGIYDTVVLVAATYLAANAGGMPRKPQPPSQRTKWHVYYRFAARREWVGEIEAVDEREAIEIAAKEFKQPAKRLMAVQRR